ncbi:hypothetical protein Nepgr_006039 [Nepenthes gracilis]|uniref:Protein EARLY FLOWERING 4 domain-containing protein n=1 Tax=Nepenthes gracilis TaxID=150966 RepID=A0AAD3XH10_NEPGR|nr:hypothetical protein Nepgr_006039 [Nepenthes gracilis]
MATLDSSSAAGSGMDNGSNGDDHNHQHHNDRLKTLTATAATTGNSHWLNGFLDDVTAADGVNDDCNSEVWNEFAKSFSQVQSVLDRNRVLIQQVNENHQSKIPDNLLKNVSLIQEINGNISKVVSLYSDLSTNFSSMFHQRKVLNSKTNNVKKGGGECGGLKVDDFLALVSGSNQQLLKLD